MLSDGILSQVIPNNPVLLQHFNNNFHMTNEVIFGKHVNMAIGAAASGVVARSMGTVTPLQVVTNFARTGSLGIANIAPVNTVSSAVVTMLGKGVLIGATLEGSIIVGSGINALIQTYIQHE